MYPTLFPTTPTRFPLQQLKAITLSGPERSKFLQGQVTCDLNALEAGMQSLGGHCDPKGRLWSDFRLAVLPEALILLVKPSALPKQLAELRKYGVFSKVTIDERDYAINAIAGVGSDAWIAAQFGLSDCGLIEGGIALRVTADRWLLVTETALNLQLPLGDETTWWGLEILSGLPHLEAVHQGELLPQMVNLERLEGICFTKGCYMGQEAVARAHYRGTNNRALYVLSGHGKTAELGAPLELALERDEGERWKATGMILNVWQQGETLLMTAVLPNDLQANAKLRLKGDENSQLSVMA